MCRVRVNGVNALMSVVYRPFFSFLNHGCRAGDYDVVSLLSKAGFDVSHLSILKDPNVSDFHSETTYGAACKPQ